MSRLPGRPGELWSAAMSLEQTGAIFTDTGSGLARLSTDGWSGSAADAFRSVFDGEPLRWERAGSAFAEVGRALSDYAEALTAGQSESENAEALRVEGDARTASARASHDAAAARALQDAVAAPGTLRIPPPPAAFVDPGESLRVEAARTLAAAAEAVRVAGDAAAAAVRAACRHAPEKPRWWERAVDAVADAIGIGIGDGDAAWISLVSGPHTDAGDPQVLAAQLARLRAAGVPPSEYRDLVRSYWYSVAGQRAGIDLAGWDPALGADALRGTIEDVYSYYGRLYLENPHLQWAGMANMIGPSFAAGFFDLEAISDIADTVAGPLDEVPDLAKPLLPPGLRDIAMLSDLTQSELGFYEQSFLSMQKEIFIDQAVMHEAYLTGGLPAVRELGAAGVIDPTTVQAWERIEQGRLTGDQDLVTAGNVELLRREQEDVIKDDYEKMYSHLPSGPAFTYLMSAVGEPSIPGAQGLAEFRPLEVTTPGSVPLPGPIPDLPAPAQVTVTTPLPDGNLADFDDRWALITEDTLPAYQDMLRTDPEGAAAIIGSDVAGRIEANRLHNQADDIAGRLATGWDVRVRR